MPVITITRQFGSLGDEIGKDVAERLGLQLVDQAAIDEVAQRLGIQSGGIREADEWEGTVVADLVRTMRRLYPATITPQREDAPEPDEATQLQVIREVIWEVARANSSVIVGRGATHVLESNPDVLHVLMVAPLPVRIERVMAAERLDMQRATQRVRQVDNNRSRYTRHFYGVDWLDVNHYDLVLNTGHLPPATAASLVCTAAAGESPTSF